MTELILNGMLSCKRKNGYEERHFILLLQKKKKTYKLSRII